MPTLVPYELGGLNANVAGLVYVDRTNRRVGIGTTSPQANLHIVGNVFISSSLNTFSGNLAFTAGSQTAPGLSVTDDADTGIFSPGTNRLVITAGGIAHLSVNAAAVQISNLTVNAGSATNPSISFANDINTGFYAPTPADTVAFSSGGSMILSMNSRFLWNTTSSNAVFGVGSNMMVAGEHATNPSYTWIGNPLQGMGRTSTGLVYINASIGGQNQIQLSPSGSVYIGGDNPNTTDGMTLAPMANIGQNHILVSLKSNTGSGTKQGIYLDYDDAAGDYTNFTGMVIRNDISNTSMGNVTNASGLRIYQGPVSIRPGAIWTNSYGLRIDLSTGGTVTRQYGIFQTSDEPTEGAYTKTMNRFASRIGIGVNPVSNVSLTISHNVAINVNGSVTNPAYTWTADSSGFYRVGTNLIAASANGVNSVTFGPANAYVGPSSGGGVWAKNTPRAWALIGITSANVPSIIDGWNFSSVTRNSQGDYTLVFANAMATTRYAVHVGVRGPNATHMFAGGVYNAGTVDSALDTGRATAQVRITTSKIAFSGGGGLADLSNISVVVFGT